MNHLYTLSIAWLAAAVMMLGLWVVQRRTGNAGIVDVAWAFGIGACVAVFAAIADGDAARRIVIAAMTGTWSVRLGLYLAARMRREEEDGRYQALREWAGGNAQTALFVFYQIQAFWVVLFTLPQYLVLQSTTPLGPIDAVALAVFLVSLIGEAIADAQLAAFKRDPANRGKTCRAGLWRYSRHPNYFFEWIHWFAYPVLAIGMGWVGWLTLLGPLTMLYFLTKVTGIPPTEARALKTRGDDYRDYRRTTSAFFPWPPSGDHGTADRSTR